MKRSLFVLSVLIFMQYVYCFNPTEPNNRDKPLNVPNENLIAFKAKFPQEYGTHLVLMDFYDKMNFRIVRIDSVRFSGCNIFSNDKTKILTHLMPWWLDIYFFAGPFSWPVSIYDIEENKIDLLIKFSLNDYELIWCKTPVWFNNNTGFFNNTGGLKYFSLDDRIKGEYVSGLNGGVFPLGVDYDDNNICLFEEKYVDTPKARESDNNRYLVKIDNSGTVLKMIVNSRLNIVRLFENTYEYSNISWDRDSDLFVFAEKGMGASKSKISVTNWDGTYYRSYTVGTCDDIVPVFGPGGDYILFQRRIHEYHNHYFKFMLIDIRTGKVSEYLNADDIGAELIYGVDY